MVQITARLLISHVSNQQTITYTRTDSMMLSGDLHSLRALRDSSTNVIPLMISYLVCVPYLFIQTSKDYLASKLDLVLKPLLHQVLHRICVRHWKRRESRQKIQISNSIQQVGKAREERMVDLNRGTLRPTSTSPCRSSSPPNMTFPIPRHDYVVDYRLMKQGHFATPTTSKAGRWLSYN